jgi:NADH:ubiquinone oxidoreductase subunit K
MVAKQVKIYAVYLMSIAGAESAIGLGILVAFYRLRGKYNTNTE